MNLGHLVLQSGVLGCIKKSAGTVVQEGSSGSQANGSGSYFSSIRMLHQGKNTRCQELIPWSCDLGYGKGASLPCGGV